MQTALTNLNELTSRDSSWFITLWDLDNPAVGDANEESGHSIEFPLIAHRAQTWVCALERPQDWVRGPLSTAQPIELVENTRYVEPTVINLADPLLANSRLIAVAVEPKGLSGICMDSYIVVEGDERKQPRDALRLVGVVQWGNAKWKDLEYAFSQCENVQLLATDSPDLSQCDSLQGAFLGTRLEAISTKWDVQGVSNFDSLFADCENFTGEGIQAWNVSSARHMAYMFSGCSRFNVDLGNWDVGRCIDFTAMFEGCQQFAGEGLLSWIPQRGIYFADALLDCDSIASSQQQEIYAHWQQSVQEEHLEEEDFAEAFSEEDADTEDDSYFATGEKMYRHRRNKISDDD